MKEIWKDIEGYEGKYQISNLGRVKSLICWTGNQFMKREKILIQRINSQTGYYVVCLSRNGKIKTRTIHRLISQSFIPNPNNYACVNHIDGNKLNNVITNLEWCTFKYNLQHAFRTGLNDKSGAYGRFGKNHWRSKKILQYDLNNNFVRQWDSINDINRELNINCGNISSCCSNRRCFKTAGGFIWRFAND